MDEIFDRIKAIKIKRKYLIASLVATELLGILVFIWLLRAPLSEKFLTMPQKAYSVVSLAPQKRYLVSQGDLLTGKAIPNTTVKVLITPGFLKSSVTANSKGEWWYQVPKDIPKSVHRITFGNFDKSKKLTTFRTYKFRVQSNISILNFFGSMKNKVSNLFSFRPASAQMSSGVIPDLYVSTGLPSPHVPITMTEDQRSRFRDYFLPYAYSAAKIVGTDWRLMAMWTYKENNLTHFQDNCLDGNKDWGEDADLNQNTPCSAWTFRGAPNWQVGWGTYAYEGINDLPEAIAVMRPGESIQQIGQRVIDLSSDTSRYALEGNSRFAPPNDPIIYPDSFPLDVTLEEIIEGSKPVEDIDKHGEPAQDPKDPFMRQLMGILMKDPAISAYLLALNWKDIFSQQQIITEIQHEWGSGFDLQIASNILAGFDNEAGGIDFEALTTTPQITLPVAVAADQHPSPVDGVQVETTVSDGGNALDDSQIADRGLKKEYRVIPYGTFPGEFDQPTPENNVKGINNIDEVYIAPEETSDPSGYQICALLKQTDFEIIIDADCVPLDQVIYPKILSDSETASTSVTSCPLNPENGEFECAEGVCKSTEYDCSSGRRWYFDEYKNPRNSCEFEAKSNADGEFAGLWYHGDLDSSCDELFNKTVSNGSVSCEPANWIDQEPYSCQDGYACYNRWKIVGGDSCQTEPDYGDDGLWYECRESDCGS